MQILAGLAWLAALASWHLTPFVLTVLLGAAAIIFLWRGGAPRMPWLVLVLAVGAFVVPVLRAKQFILSPAMCLLFGLALAVWVDGPRRKRVVMLLAGTLILAGLGLAIGTAYGEYAHVYELFLYKVRYLGVKPADPARLSWEARCLWESAFQTANWSEFWRSLQWCGPLAAVAAWRVLWRERREEEPGQPGNVIAVIVLFTLLLVPLSWMVVRYFTLLGFAAAVLAGGCAVFGRTARARTCWAVGVGVLALWQFAHLDGRPLDRGPVRPEAYRPVVAWLRENTPTNAVVLASVSESPVFWAYTGRPIVLHSKFETKTMRDRYRRFLEALYGREDRFAALAEHWGADYFIYDVGCLLTGPNTWRYKADRLGDLPPDSFARRCWEQPAALERFREVFRTERFVVFAVSQFPIRR